MPGLGLPILYALTYPDRVPDYGVPPFDPVALSPLQFEPVRHSGFPAHGLGSAAGRRAAGAPGSGRGADEQGGGGGPAGPAATSGNGEYGASASTVLEGLEAVRKRPGMYIGSTGERGLHHLVQEIVDNAVDEALAGYADHIEITLQPDGRVKVVHNGRGIPTGIMEGGGHPAVAVVLTQLPRAGTLGGSRCTVSGGLPPAALPAPRRALVYLELPGVGRGDAASMSDLVSAALLSTHGRIVDTLALAAIRQVHRAFAGRDRTATVAIRGASVVAAWPGYVDRVCGIAVDIGSTAIAGHLCDLTTGDNFSSACRLTPPIQLGEVLIDRASYVIM